MKKPVQSDKLRGGYYTPAPIARFLADWAIQHETDEVLEPSCGDGSILVEAARRLISLGSAAPALQGVELVPQEAAKACSRLRDLKATNKTEVVSKSFFDYASCCVGRNRHFDVVVGNPPFIRYQDFPEEERQKAFSLMRGIGLKPSRLSNAWLPFLAISAALLKPRARLAMVIPAELFQVGYAAEVRQFLATQFSRITIVAFEQLVFPDIQQEVVLLLAERGSTGPRGIRVHEIRNAASLSTVDLREIEADEVKPVDHASEKWTKYFLDTREILLLREMRERVDIPLLRNYLDIDVGLVTGDNDFFLLSNEQRESLGLEESTVPVIGRSAAVSGVIFTKSDFNLWMKQEKKAYLFYPSSPYDSNVRQYVAMGEDAEVNTGYKCRIRKEWFIVPGLWKPDVFFLRQADQNPRMVANETPAACTDTLHRGRVLDGVAPRQLAVAFMNSLTFAASEVTGRSYGGGVMTFEPTEVERLPLPVPGAAAIDAEHVDSLVRRRDVLGALDVVDRAVLIEQLGLTLEETRALRAIWMKLRDRRRGRKDLN